MIKPNTLHPLRCDTCDHCDVFDEDTGIIIYWICKISNQHMSRNPGPDSNVLFVDLHGCASHSSAQSQCSSWKNSQCQFDGLDCPAVNSCKHIIKETRLETYKKKWR